MLVFFALGACGLFFTFRYILLQQVDDVLEAEREEVLQYIQTKNALPPPVSVSDQQLYYRAAKTDKPATIKSTEQEVNGETEDFRVYRFPVLFKAVHYQFYVVKPLEETEQLLAWMALVTMLTIGVMLLAIYAFNRSLVRRLLKPFFATVGIVRNYSMNSRMPLALPETKIEEFSLLNQTLNEMTARGLKDYQLMRDFTAQAAHEMQTPLSIIRTKLETLMQSAQLDAALAEGINGVDETVERLSRLFKSLLLLTKIENRQFEEKRVVEVDKMITMKLEELQDLIRASSITASIEMEETLLNCNPYLVEILAGNLINNAIRYNYPGGALSVHLRPDKLVVANTSAIPRLEESEMFRSFYRHPESGHEGSGLGLSIVKEICEVAGYKVKYDFAKGVHRFIIHF